MAPQQVGERGLLIVDTGIYPVSIYLSLGTQCIHVLSYILYRYLYTQGPGLIPLDPLVSPLLASSTAAAAPVCVVAGVRMVYLLLLSNRLDVCLFGDRGPFYQQFHSIVKCENNKLSIQYRTDTIWISKG